MNKWETWRYDPIRSFTWSNDIDEPLVENQHDGLEKSAIDCKFTIKSRLSFDDLESMIGPSG